MMVDDEPDVNYTFENVLDDNGFLVDSFINPILALKSFKPCLYDLVIVDIKMPEIDGFKLYEEIMKIDSNVKVCFLTASEVFYEEYRALHSEIAKNIQSFKNQLEMKI